jgi:hypothetical protein
MIQRHILETCQGLGYVHEANFEELFFHWLAAHEPRRKVLKFCGQEHKNVQMYTCTNFC